MNLEEYKNKILEEIEAELYWKADIESFYFDIVDKEQAEQSEFLNNVIIYSPYREYYLTPMGYGIILKSETNSWRIKRAVYMIESYLLD